MDDTVIAAWARKAKMTLPSGGDVLHGWGDMEIAYDVRDHHGRIAVDNVSRGDRRILATFAHVDDADRLLLLLLASVWRSLEQMPALRASGYSTTVHTDTGPTSITLDWRGGDAEFSAGGSGRFYSSRYSYLAGRSVDEMDAALSDPQGRPLFSV